MQSTFLHNHRCTMHVFKDMHVRVCRCMAQYVFAMQVRVESPAGMRHIFMARPGDLPKSGAPTSESYHVDLGFERPEFSSNDLKLY